MFIYTSSMFYRANLAAAFINQEIAGKDSSIQTSRKLLLIKLLSSITLRCTQFYSLLINIFLELRLTRQTKSASSSVLLVSHKCPTASLWNDLLLLPNQQVSYPSPTHDSRTSDVGNTDAVLSVHNAPAISSTPDPEGGRRRSRDSQE